MLSTDGRHSAVPSTPTERGHDEPTRRAEPADRAARPDAARPSSQARRSAAATDPARVVGAAAGAVCQPGTIIVMRAPPSWQAWDRDRDAAARPDFHDFDCAAVQFDRPAGDRQAEAGAPGRGGSAGEALEHAFAFGRRDARPLVADVQSQSRRLGARAPAPTPDRAAGLCRMALSTRLTTTCRSRAGSATATRSGGDAVTTTSTSSGDTATCPTASRRNSSTRNWVTCSGITPPSRRERSSRLVTSSPSRSVCDNAIRMVSASGSATPSTTFSSTACRAVIGVRNSCETLAISPRRYSSAAPRSAAI